MINVATLGMFGGSGVGEGKPSGIGGMMPPSYRGMVITEDIKVRVSSVSEEDHEQIVNVKVVSLTEGES